VNLDRALGLLVTVIVVVILLVILSRLI